MPEYIEREKVLSMSYCTNKPTWDNPHLDPKSVVDVDDIEALPTADVVEVRHGEWIPIPEYENKRCSVCRAVFSDFTLGYYCPNCGAKMGV